MQNWDETAVTHRQVRVNGIEIHLAEAGDGPPVILLHGFPELWYSWRHQLTALAAAGYHAIAPDVRGYGGSTAPTAVEDYRMSELVSDVTGLLDVLGAPTATLVGHDWGAQILWACAQLHPQRFPALAAMSVPYQSRPAAPPTEQTRQWSAGKFNYLLYFQEPGVAEAELEADVRRSMRLILYGLSGDAPDELGIRLLTNLPAGSRLLDPIPEPSGLPSWLTEADLAYYTREFTRTGFTGGLNRYRNIDRDWHELPQIGLTRVEQPVLFLAGEVETSTRFSGTEMRDYVPNVSEPVVLPGCGHWVQQERPDAVNRLLIEFLDSVVPGASR